MYDLGSNPITGRTAAKIADATRILACDMNAAAALWTVHGDEWAYWLAERCAGREVTLSEGVAVRVVSPLPRRELGVILYALLASDRQSAEQAETPESLGDHLSDEEAIEIQQLVTRVVTPCFLVPGKGLAKEVRHKRKRPVAKREIWSWRRILQTAFGVYGIAPETFWKLTLAEWRMWDEGYAERERNSRRKLAWLSSNQLIAAGCEPDKVTPAKLLGEKPPVDKVHRRKVREAVLRMKQRVGPDPELLRAVHQATRGRVGGDLLAAAGTEEMMKREA